MEIKQDTSYGVIPYIEENDKIYFFLIYQWSSVRNDAYWVFPKGHAEGAESEEESALRELKEETGLSVSHLHSDHPFVITYEFTYKETKIEKSVIYFLGKVSSKEYVLQEEEVKDARWLMFNEALSKISYGNSKALLEEANAYLGDNFKES